MTYQSPEDARTDLFLSAGVFLLGPLILNTVLFDLFRLNLARRVIVIYLLVEAIVTTVLVPILLLRYRRDTLRGYGFGHGLVPLLQGIVLVIPIVVVDAAISWIQSRDPLLALPVAQLATNFSFDTALQMLERVVAWGGFGFLMLYLTIKARDAFRPNPLALSDAVRKVGLVIAVVGVGAVLLLWLGEGADLIFLAFVAGVAATVALTLRWHGATTSVDRMTVIAPVLVAALRPFAATLNAPALLAGLFAAALTAAIALAVVILTESRRASEIAIGLGVGVGLLTNLGGIGL